MSTLPCERFAHADARADTGGHAPSWGRALASAGLVIYAGNQLIMPCTIRLLQLNNEAHADAHDVGNSKTCCGGEAYAEMQVQGVLRRRLLQHA